jgi:hypothetical protein
VAAAALVETSEATVPDETTFAEWVAGYFTHVSEGRSPMWLLERRDDEARMV